MKQSESPETFHWCTEEGRIQQELDSRMNALATRLGEDPDDWPTMLHKVEKLIEETKSIEADPFTQGLMNLINMHEKESGSNTQDFILADFLAMNLRAWDYCTRYRDQVQGRMAEPGATPLEA